MIKIYKMAGKKCAKKSENRHIEDILLPLNQWMKGSRLKVISTIGSDILTFVNTVAHII